MPVRTTLLDLPLGRGVNEGVDARQLAPGSYAEVLNWCIDREGRFTKRPGYVAGIGELSAGVSMSAADKLCTIGKELLAIGHDGASCQLQTRAPSWGYWQDPDTVPHLTCASEPLVRNLQFLKLVSLVYFGTGTKRFELVAYGDFDGATVTLRYRVRDLDADALVISDTTITTTAGTVSFFRLVPIDGHAWVIYCVGAGLIAFQVHGGTLATSSITLDATVAGFTGDAYPIASNRVLVAYTDATTTLRLRKFNGSGVAVSTRDKVYAVNVQNARVAGTSGGQVVVAMDAPVPNDVIADGLNDNATFTDAWAGTTTVMAYSTLIDLSVEMDASGGSVVAFSGEGSAGEDAVIAYPLTSAGVLGAGRIAVRCALASSLKRIDGGVYAALHVTTGGSSFVSAFGVTTSAPAHGALFRFDDTSSSSALTYWGTYLRNTSRGPVSGILTPHSCSRLWEVESGVWTFAALSLLLVQPGLDAITAERVTVRSRSARRTNGALWQTTQANRLLLLSGGALSFYDRFGVYEVGFLQPPEITGHSTAGAGAGAPEAAAAPGNTYLYAARYEWCDDQGNLHTSAWSNLHSVTLINPTSPYYDVTLTIKQTGATRRDRRGPNRKVYITVWRSLKNGATSDGRVRVYKLSPYGDGTGTSARLNSKIAYSTTYVDTQDDATMRALGLGQYLFPSGDVLEALPPPPQNAICAHRGRLWLADATDPQRIWFSRTLVPGEAPAFHDAFTLRLDDSPEGVTALASLDDKLVVFTESRIFYVVGDGPNDTGANGAFGGPYQVVSQLGCIDARSVSVTPAGVYFQSRAGLTLLDRSLAVNLVGDPVQDTLEAFPDCQGAQHDATNSRVVWLQTNNAATDSRFVVLDYLRKAWFTWQVGDPTSTKEVYAHVVSPHLGHVIAHSDGVCVETVDSPTDTVGGAAVWITSRLTTPWIRQGSVSGIELARRLHVSGERLSYCVLYVEQFYDFSASGTSTSFALSSGSAVDTPDMPRLAVDLAQQKATAWKFTIRDSAASPLGGTSGQPRGLRLWGLSLEITPTEGLAKLPAANLKG